MSPTPSFRTALPVALLLCALTASFLGVGCDLMQPIEPAPKVTPAPPAKVTPVVNQAPEAILATVNGTALSMQPLYDALVSDYGMQIAQILLADELVRQAIVKEKLSLTVSKMDIDAESSKTLQQLFPFGAPPTKRQIEGLLAQFLTKRNLSRRQWDASMRRNLLLARLAETRIGPITEEDLRELFFLQYDGKIIVRHIQTPSLSNAQTLLKSIRDGEPFAKVAQTHSTSPSGKDGGLLPPIGARTAPPGVPPALLQAAKALKKPGEVSSPIQVGTAFHILKLEEIIPPQAVKYAQVEPQLRALAHEQRIHQLQPVIMRELFSKADIQFVDPTLREQRKNAKAAANANAAAPAKNPA